MGSDRVHIVMAAEERAAFRAAAERAGMSLSQWLREAARAALADAQPALSTGAALDRFFADCDAREGDGTEPDWDEHLRVIQDSRVRGLPT